MVVETWPISRIKPYERNARKIPQSAIDKVALSLRTFGWRQPIVVDTAGVIVVGHVRRLGALQNGYTDAPVHVADGLTPEQVKAYRLMDNRSNEETTWDLGLLGPELTDLKGFNLDLSLTGFDANELSRLLPQDYVEPEPQLERADELQAKWQVERGQVWEIGAHRLMVGDSFEAELERCDLLFTDPPYGINLLNGKNGKVGGGTREYPTTAFSPIVGDDTGINPQRFISLCRYAVIFGGNYFADKLPVSRCWLIWDKHHPVDRTFAGCELAWTNLPRHSKVYACTWDGWTKEGQSGSKAHPTEKPVKLCREIIQDIEASTVLDPFLGVGATMVAAENLKRRCYGMEIEPKYCAVTLERMADMGLTPRVAS